MIMIMIIIIMIIIIILLLLLLIIMIMMIIAAAGRGGSAARSRPAQAGFTFQFSCFLFSCLNYTCCYHDHYRHFDVLSISYYYFLFILLSSLFVTCHQFLLPRRGSPPGRGPRASPSAASTPHSLHCLRIYIYIYIYTHIHIIL